jgi:hypothetical protein
MTNGDPNQVLMQLAWKRLWKPGTPYYLPNAILHGAQGNGVTVDALGRLDIADTGQIPLVDSDTWGKLSVDLQDATVAGLDTMADGGMTYTPASGAFRATISIAQAVFAGNYAVSGSGITGCAVESASSLLKAMSPKGDAMTAAAEGVGDDGELDVARNYRDQLVTSSAGLDHVASYYDNNETFNEIVTGQNGPNAFTMAWPNATPMGAGKNSAYFAAQTSNAAQNPLDPNATVGDEDYRGHSFYMQGIMLKTLLGYKKQAGDKYDQAAQATLGFHGEVTSPEAPQGAVTVGTVMEAVGTTPPPTYAATGGGAPPEPDAVTGNGATPSSEIAERAAALVEEDYPHWEAEAAKERERMEAERAATATSISGQFIDQFTVPAATISGTIEVVGVSPNTSLQATLTGLDAQIPKISVTLSGSGGMLDAAQNAIANASWFQDILTKKVHDRLNQQDILGWLTARVNQSITQALGSFG